jgi:hypothetical protein
MKVTIEQLQAMREIAKLADFEEARHLFALLGVTPRTTFNTEEEKRIALKCRAAMYNTRDKGMYGKLNEIEKRVNASKAPMPWHSFAARTPNLADQTIKVDGVTYALEHKSGAGDWYKTHCETLEKAMSEYTKRNKILVWDTDEFTLVIPFNKLIEGLDSYNGRGKAKGWKTFFKTTLSMASDGTAYVVGMQEWKTSKPKIKYLQDLADENAEWFDLVKDMIF